MSTYDEIKARSAAAGCSPGTIAYAAEDVPGLFAEVERLKAENERLRGWLEDAAEELLGLNDEAAYQIEDRLESLTAPDPEWEP
jgi:hypothetical protein